MSLPDKPKPGLCQLTFRLLMGGYFIVSGIEQWLHPVHSADPWMAALHKGIPFAAIIAGVLLLLGIFTSFILRLYLGGFYLVAGGLKVFDPGKFAEAVDNYRLLPHELINLVAITLPWIEVVAGLLLVLGIWLRASAVLINAMTLMFIAAISSAVARGLSIECGCFGTVGGRRVGLNAIAEDLGLLLCGLFVLWAARRKPSKPAPPEVVASSPHPI